MQSPYLLVILDLVGALEVWWVRLLGERVSEMHRTVQEPCLTEFAVENPARKWPGVFNSVPLFVRYPYLLPCMVASSVTLTGEN